MNKEKAINILLEHAIDSCEKIKIRKNAGHTEEVADNLTAAILFLEHDKNKNKVDAKIEITGLQVNSHKGA
tara:strand:- start:881 stop:1093 length:213 start_codon:yes stop_codon:yes gene_type:complete